MILIRLWSKAKVKGKVALLSDYKPDLFLGSDVLIRT